jgi:SAM-dependent methyltransferase
MDRTCRICGNGEKNAPFVAREMMFGTRETFDYFECARCGCLQIAEVPGDLSRYYPPGYYAHSEKGRAPKRTFRRRMQMRAAAGMLGRGSVLERLLGRLWKPPPFVEWARRSGSGFDAAILDVGSGTGGLLRQMAAFGFTNLTGIDPNVERDLAFEDGVRVFKRDLPAEHGRYDMVMLHHAVEHVPDPHAALVDVRRILRPGRCLLVRVPVKDSVAWEEYGVDWVQLDAPRHLYLFTQESLRRLAEGAGFRVERIVHDSSPFQFWGSELYRRDIPLHSPEHGERSPRHYFPKRQIRAWRRRTARLNREGRSDAAAFYLRAS